MQLSSRPTLVLIVAIVILASAGAGVGTILGEGGLGMLPLTVSQALTVGEPVFEPTLPPDVSRRNISVSVALPIRGMAARADDSTSFTASAEVNAGDVFLLMVPLKNSGKLDVVAELTMDVPAQVRVEIFGSDETSISIDQLVMGVNRSGPSQWRFCVGAGADGTAIMDNSLGIIIDTDRGFTPGFYSLHGTVKQVAGTGCHQVARADETPTPRPTATPVATSTNTPLPPATPTQTPTSTSTATATATGTSTPTATAVPATATSTATATPTNTPMATPTPSTALLSAVADSYVQQDGAAANSNFGTLTTMYIESYSSNRNRRSLVKFNTGLIPSSATVLSAGLWLYMPNAPATSRTWESHVVTASWGETTVTWNTQPPFAGTASAADATGTSSNTWLQWDVTADVQAFVSGTSANYGWLINDQTEDSGSNQNGQVNTRENGGYTPVLFVSYRP